MKFLDRALLKVYLEAEDLDRFCAQALAQGKATADYARKLILEHLNETAASEDLRRLAKVPTAERSAAAPRPPARTPADRKPAPEPVKQMQFTPPAPVQEKTDCKHDYGPKKCPFVGCPNYKWRDEK